MTKFIISIIFIFICSLSTINGQDKVLIEQYNFSDTLGSINHILIDRENTKWIASTNGIFNFKSFEGPIKQIKSNINATSLALGKKLEIWAAFANGTIENLNTDVKIEFEKAKSIKINCLEVIKSKIYVGTNQGVFVYNSKTGKYLDKYNLQNSNLKSNAINFIHLDAYDIIWIGTEKGMSKLKEKNLKKPYDQDLNFKLINENSDGKWIISDKEMFLVYDKNRWQEIGLKEDIYEGEINDMVLDNNGKIYIASNKLVRVDPYKNLIEGYSDDVGLISEKCLALACDNYNHIYIGTELSGLFRLRFTDNEAENITASVILESTVKCAGEAQASLAIFAAGGHKPYKYKWNKSNIRGKNPKGLRAGTYSVTVTDAYNVEFSAQITVREPEPLKLELLDLHRLTGINSNDGRAKVQATGGKKNYKFKWSNGEQNAEAISLSAGKHTVTVTDENKCKSELKIEVPKAKLIPKLDISKIKIGQTLKINQLFFEADSSLIVSKSFLVLDEIKDFLIENETVVIEIGGHTNGIPSHEYCDKLSASRAQNVAEYLFENGIIETRISYKGYGKRRPIASNSSLAGRKMNQRVEIKILEI